MELFFPEPAQAGHFTRINATPSDLPLMSTGVATNPVPPQRGQSVGATRPLNWDKFFTKSGWRREKVIYVTKSEQTGREAVAWGAGRALGCGTGATVEWAVLLDCTG